MATTAEPKAVEPETVGTGAEDGAATVETTQNRASRVIRQNTYWAMGAGVIPWALLDTAAVVAVQLKMLKELGDVYGVPFSANAGKSAVTALLATVAGGAVGHGVLGTGAFYGLVRYTPVIGPIIGIATMPAFYAAFTYAVGKVFDRHFASGGTFLSFDAKAAAAEFRETFEEGKAEAKAKAKAAKAKPAETAA